MRIAENWKDYKIIDTSSGDKHPFSRVKATT